MHLLVLIATWLVVTANGYTFQKAVRPSAVHYPMASRPHLNTGKYNGQQVWISDAVNGNPVAGTRAVQTSRQSIGARSYLPKQSYVPVPPNIARAPVTAGPRTYQVQHATQAPITVKTQPFYAAKVSKAIKPTTPKLSERITVNTSQPYPSWPLTANHLHIPTISSSQTIQTIPVEVSHRHNTGNQTTNLQPPRWFPSYGIGVNKANQSRSSVRAPATTGNQQQRATQSAGQLSTKKVQKDKEVTKDSLNALHEPPLQTAVFITRKSSQKGRTTTKSPDPNVPVVIPGTTPQPNAVSHLSPTITKTISIKTSMLLEGETSSYQNVPINLKSTLSQSESLDSSSVTTYQDGMPHLALENANLQLQFDIPVADQLSNVMVSTEAGAAQVTQFIDPSSSGEYVSQLAISASESIIPVTDENSSRRHKNPSDDQQPIPDPVVTHQLPHQSASSLTIHLPSVEKNPPQDAKANEAVSFDPSFFTKDAQPPVEEPSPVVTVPYPPASSFNNGVIPKYVLEAYSSLVLPEPPLALANSAYGVTSFDESQPTLESQQPNSTPFIGNYGLSSISHDNTHQQEWGYYSAEPFPSSSSHIGQVNISPFATAHVNNQQSFDDFQPTSPSQEQTGYPFSQGSSAGFNTAYSHETTEDLKKFHSAANHWISSNGARARVKGHQPGKDSAVGIVSSSNVLNQDRSFSYNYETEDGIKVDASGYQKQLGGEPGSGGAVAKGSYSYTAPDGVKISVTWVADENGFQPVGDHIPTRPLFLPGDMIAHLSAGEKMDDSAVPAGWVQSVHAY